MTVFDEQYARYYDLLYADKDYEAEAGYVAGLIRHHKPDARSILDLGCGTGRHAEILADHGFRVHGVDQSEAMILRAQARAAAKPGSLSFSVGDVTSYSSAERYDAIISLFHVVSYQTTNEALQSMFRAAAAQLSDDGVFIFDVWYGPAVLTQRPEVRIKRLEDGECAITRIAEPVITHEHNVVEVNYTILSIDKRAASTAQFHETHRMRYLFRPEIELLLECAGLRLAGAEEWLSGNPSSDATWSVCFSAVKSGATSGRGSANIV